MRRQLRAWSAAGVVVVATVALVPSWSWQSEATPSRTSSAATAAAPRDGRIVAANFDTGQLETVNPDGSERRVITPAGESAFQPTWSPDGTRIVFTSDHAGPDFKLFTIKADGTDIRQLGNPPEGYSDFTPSYTPDGQRVLYTRCRPDPPGGCAVFSIRVNGLGNKRVTAYDGVRSDFFPVMSPDGKRLAFSRFDDRGISVQTWVANADGSNPRAITTPGLEAAGAKWTRDSHHLLITSYFRHLGENIYRVRDDGKDLTKLTSVAFPHNAQFAAMSPSGKQIVYTDDRAYPGIIGGDLFVMKADGSGKHAIATQTRLLQADWGTAPLIEPGSGGSTASQQKAAAPHRAPAGSTGLPSPYDEVGPSGSKWSR